MVQAMGTCKPLLSLAMSVSLCHSWRMHSKAGSSSTMHVRFVTFQLSVLGNRNAWKLTAPGVRAGFCSNVVLMGNAASNLCTLQVEAEASTDSNARPGFVPRQKPGLAIFGKSSNSPPAHSVGLPPSATCAKPPPLPPSFPPQGLHKILLVHDHRKYA